MKNRYDNPSLNEKTKKFPLLEILLIAILIILGISIKLVLFPIVKTNKTDSAPIRKETIEKNQSFSLIAVGDALIHDGVYQDAKTSKKGSNGYPIYSFSKMFTDIAPIIKDYDLKFYNQETIIGGKKIGLSSYPRFNSPDEIGKDMTKIGFNLVNLATNHTLDRGEKAIQYSTEFWNRQNVYAVGSYNSKEESNKVIIKEQNGITYTLLGYTVSTNGIPVPKGKEYLVNVYDKEKVKQDIEKVKNKVDVIIVSMHWGTEYTNTPTKEQREIAKYLSSLGVDVIIGHHPHVIEPIEFIDNTLVIYSLGNFISAQEGTNKRVGMIAAFTIHKKTVRSYKQITIEDVKGDLLWTYYKEYHNFKVIPFSKLNNKQLNNYKGIYQKYSSIINKTKDSRITTGFIK